MEGISKKIYLELDMPTEEDSRSDQKRIQDRLEKEGLHAVMSFYVMKKLYPLWQYTCHNFVLPHEGYLTLSQLP